jgi:2-iminobutanoate/2-iminopropanoate deaminase
VALDRGGRIVGASDMRAQLHQVLEAIRTASPAGDIRRAFFAAPYPVTTTVEVARLYDRALLVEISAIAESPRQRFMRP